MDFLIFDLAAGPRTAQGSARIHVRDSRPKGRDTGAPARILQIPGEAWRAGGSAPLATVVSLPTAREARPGAQRRDTPNLRRSLVPELRPATGYDSEGGES